MKSMLTLNGGGNSHKMIEYGNNIKVIDDILRLLYLCCTK